MPRAITDDVVRAVRLLFHEPRPNDKREAEVKLREKYPPDDGWFLPGDLARSGERGSGLAKACEIQSTTRLVRRLNELNIIEHSKDGRFLRLRRDPEGLAEINRFVLAYEYQLRRRPRSTPSPLGAEWNTFLKKVASVAQVSRDERAYAHLKYAYARFLLAKIDADERMLARLKAEEKEYAKQYPPELVGYHMGVDVAENTPKTYFLDPYTPQFYDVYKQKRRRTGKAKSE